MRESELLRDLCDALTNALGVEFIPETWRDGCVSVFLAGGSEKKRSYVDGSAIAELPIEIKARSVMRNESDRLRVIDILSGISSVREISLGDGESAVLCSAGHLEKTKTYENGSEEYTSPFVLRYFKRSASSRKEKNENYRKI